MNIPKLEELYGIIFVIKGVTNLTLTTSESEILNKLEPFKDNRNPWLTVGKKGKIIHCEETPTNELERKQPASKKFELFIFGDSITKKINPSFIAKVWQITSIELFNRRCRGARSIQADVDFQRKSSRSSRNKCNNPPWHKSPSQRPP